MSTETFELDIDRELVHYDGEWLGVEDLSSRIKQKVAAGDFRVARLSLALQRLEEALESVKTVELRVTPELFEAFARIADAEQQPVSTTLRRALVHYLASEDATRRLYKARQTSARHG